MADLGLLRTLGLIAILAITILCVLFLHIKARRRMRLFQDIVSPPDLKSDADERKLAEQIRLSKRQLETTFDAITDPICVIDADYTILRVNLGYAKETSVSIRDALGKRCYSLFFGMDHPCAVCAACETFASNKPTLRKNATRDLNGEIRYYEINAYPVAGADGGVINVIEHICDVTEERKILEQLIRSEKLATIGVMTAGIAHEMNNALSGISGNASNLMQMPEKYGLNERGLGRVSTILDGATRSTRIIKDLLHLSRKSDALLQLTDLNALLAQSLESVHLEGYQHIRKEQSFDATLPCVLCDSGKIEQVFINIIQNAAQSVLERTDSEQGSTPPYQGVIRLATSRHGSGIKISIIDNGMGIEDNIKNKIFDPFFTTRPPGQGTGLGLSISNKIIEEHRGQITVESRSGETSFSIILPLDSNTPSGV